MGDKQPIDLLKAVVAPEKQHPNFKRIMESATTNELAVLEKWAEGFVDRDGKFAIEFQSTFNSSFWELYLYALWRELGCVVDLSASRPDFSVSGPLGNFVAEAVVTSNPDSGIPEWVGGATQPPPAREDILDLAALRLTQAIRAKHRKWTKDYQHLPHCAGKPFIVCVAPFDQPSTWMQGTQAIDRVLFGGPEVVQYTHGDVEFPVGHASTSAAWKPSGASVPLGLFTSPELADVSAVVFSSLATWSKVTALADLNDEMINFQAVRLHHDDNSIRQTYQTSRDYAEGLQEGAHIFLNPHARLPIEGDAWQERGIGVHIYNPEGTESYVPDGLLLFRSAWRLVPRDDDEPGLAPHQVPSHAKRHRKQLPPDGVLFGGPSKIHLADSVMLMLHRGWTVYVGRDIVDGDWCTIGKPGSHTDIQAFLSAEPSQAFQGGFVATREEALDEARLRIDALLDGL